MTEEIRKMYEYRNCRLILILEPGWSEYEFEDKQTDDPLTFVKVPDGIGALQISIAINKEASEMTGRDTQKV